MNPTTKALLLAVTFAATASPGHGEVTRIQLTDPTSPAVLRVEIEWGSIEILADPAAAALTVEARPDRPGEVAGSLISASEDANRVVVAQSPLPSGTFRSANLEIRTPARTDLELVMRRGGDIRVEGIEGLVEVTNLNGSVELVDLFGAAAVNASNGAISAGFAAVDREQDMIFTSLNGSVELCLPADFSARLHLTTAGDVIRSEFDIERTQGVRAVPPGGATGDGGIEIEGRIGSGEAQLRAATLHGEISLRRCG